MTATPAADRWRAELAAWAIPDRILDAAPESPYGFPVGLFRAAPEPTDTPSRARALEALPPGGSVLDVGCGGGAASLALVPPAGSLVGVDSAPGMLEEYAAAAAARGVEHRVVAGDWPAAAAEAGTADVVVCHHVTYNVADLVPFVRALTAAARHRVVVEMTDVHPWVPTNPLWQRFHGLDRPAGPTADDCREVLAEVGVAADWQRWERPAHHHDRADTVALVRRRLCLPVERESEVDAALPPDYAFSPRAVTTLWWPGGATPR